MSQTETTLTAVESVGSDLLVSYVFGQKGGNMLPFTVTVNWAGQVSVTGHIRDCNQHLTLSKDTLDGVRKLAGAEGFFSMPAELDGGVIHPDIPIRFITIESRTATGPATAKTVELHGGSHPAFNQLFAVLMAATGVSY